MRITFSLLVGVLLFTACGSFPFKTKDSKRKPKAIIAMSGAHLSKATTVKLYNSELCRTDPRTGLTKISFVDGMSELHMEIRGDLTPNSYICKQAVNNATDKTHIGDRYETCMVEVVTQSPQYEYGRDGYGMHRDSPDLGLFHYHRDCRIDLTNVGDRLRGEVHCEEMAQTMYRNIPRNPISLNDSEPDVTADFDGPFTCEWTKGELTVVPEPAPPPTTVAEATFVWGEEQVEDERKQIVTFNKTAACDLDTESGLLQVRFEGADASLRMAIRDFTRVPSQYACEQAEDNGSDLEEIGDLYNNCMVEAAFESDLSEEGQIAFAMHRATTDTKLFTYASECAVNIAEVENDRLKGQITCADMAQTVLNGAPRNPVAQDDIHADVTASLSANISCRINSSGDQ